MDSFRDSNQAELPVSIRHAIRKLERAREYAISTGSDLWDFAVEMETLDQLGCSLSDYRLMTRLGLVSHKKETTAVSQDGRVFEATGDLMFPQGTCFVIKESNRAFPDEAMSHRLRVSHTDNAQVDAREGVAPSWDSETRELFLGRVLVKRFRWRAANQERILSAFEEENWPARIDDPLTPCGSDLDSKRRLSDTIKCLNRKQDMCLMRFRGDGTGEGVLWHPIDPACADGMPPKCP